MADEASAVAHWYSFAVFVALGLFFLFLRPGTRPYEVLRLWVRSIERPPVRFGFAALFFLIAFLIFIAEPAPLRESPGLFGF
jgi:branched-subunit amino acid permease